MQTTWHWDSYHLDALNMLSSEHTARIAAEKEACTKPELLCGALLLRHMDRHADGWQDEASHAPRNRSALKLQSHVPSHRLTARVAPGK